MVSKILNLILEFIYPPKCMACDNIIPLENERWICNKCKDLFKYIEGNTCLKCGIILQTSKTKCNDCIERNNIFTTNKAVYIYEGRIQNIIHKFKYGKKSYLGKGLGILMLNNLLLTPDIFKDIDYIVPIPIHKNRKRKRGFNQAELLAKEVSKGLGIPMASNLIIRKKDTKPQSKFSPLGRKNNLKNAFVVNNKYYLKNKNILLIDDIYTTGNTLNACCEVLYKVEVNQVKATTLSIVLKSK